MTDVEIFCIMLQQSEDFVCIEMHGLSIFLFFLKNVYM